MKNSRIISAALLFTAVSALAEGDPARGKALTGACVACHQEDGNGRAPSMKPFSMMLDDAKAADIAAYYASLPPAAIENPASPDAAQLERGKQLAEQGDASKQIKPCTECHGADNRGDGKIPAITAQPASYLRAQITAWKQGDRPNDSADPKGMFQTARHLDDADSAAVAAWLSTQAP